MRSERLTTRLGPEHGNTLLLMPAAVLVLFVLAAIAVDAAVLFLGQRRVADLAASVAQDAVAAIDHGDFYADDDLRIDDAGARSRAAALRDELPTDDAFRDPACDLEAVGVRAEVTCTASVRLIFAPVVPGSDRIRTVEAVEVVEGRHE